MPRFVAVLALLVSIGRIPAFAEAPPGAPPAEPALRQETKVAGTPPRLDGRWLALVTLGAEPSGPRKVASIWEATRKDGALALNERFIRLPDPMQQALEKGSWEPTPEDLAEIARRADTLETESRGIAQVQSEIFGRDGFDDQLRQDAVTKDAFWVVRQLYTFAPGRSRPVRQVNLYAAEGDVDGVLRGKYVGVTVAAAPFPIPIRLEGTFRLFPLDASRRSFWSRLGDFFKGCNP